MEDFEGFEPPELLHPTVFKTAAINQTLPKIHKTKESRIFQRDSQERRNYESLNLEPYFQGGRNTKINSV